MIIVTGSVYVGTDKLSRALALSLEHVKRSRSEPGCLFHTVFQDVEDPSRLFFYERWADRAALHAHFTVPQSGAFVQALGVVAERPPEMLIYEAEQISD